MALFTEIPNSEESPPATIAMVFIVVIIVVIKNNHFKNVSKNGISRHDVSLVITKN